MENFDFTNTIYYCLFGLFVYYQQLHLKSFQGASKGFEIFLTFFVFAGMITGLIFLVMHGIEVVWWAPLILFVVGIVFTIVGVFIEKLVGGFALSMIGFIAWPIFAYLMFTTIPY